MPDTFPSQLVQFLDVADVGFSPPDPIVSMMEHHGMVFVATTRMVYVKGGDDVLRPLRFASPLDD